MHCCDIVKVAQKRHEDAISYRLYPTTEPPPQAPKRSDVVEEPKTPRREEYFETSTSAVQQLGFQLQLRRISWGFQRFPSISVPFSPVFSSISSCRPVFDAQRFSPQCAWHYEVMEHRRDAREYSQVLGRPQTRSRLGEARAASQEPRPRPPAPLRRPCVPRAPSSAKVVRRVDVDPRALVLQEIKSRAARHHENIKVFVSQRVEAPRVSYRSGHFGAHEVAELVKQKGVLQELSSPRSTTGKVKKPKEQSPSWTSTTASPQSARLG